MSLNSVKNNLLLISVLCSLVLGFLLVTAFDYLEMSKFLRQNADVLYIGDIAKDLNLGGRLFDWRLTQASYLFPDIAFARLLLMAGVETTTIALAYQVLYAIILIMLLSYLSYILRGYFVSTIIILSSLLLLSLQGEIFKGEISPFIFLIGFHSGILLPSVLILILLVKIERCGENKTPWLIAYFVVLFLGSVSDSLLVFLVGPLLFALTVIGYIGRFAWKGASFKLLVLSIAAIISAKIFLLLNPFPQEKEFLGRYIAMFPHLIAPAFKNFIRDLTNYSSSSALALLLLVLVISALLFNFKTLVSSVKNKDASLSIVFLNLICVAGLPFLLFLQIIFGLYDDVYSARQWAPVLLLVFFGAVMGTENKSIPNIIILIANIIILAAATSSLVIFMKSQKGLTAPDVVYNKFVACLISQSGIGNYYISDYWIARPIRMYSNNKLGVNPYLTLNMLFTNAAKVSYIRVSDPKYIIIGGSITEENVLARFGKPSLVKCDMVLNNGYGIKMFDYEDNATARAILKEEALKAY
jgi:hypothetical protein